MKKGCVIMAAATILGGMASMAGAATVEELQQQVDELKSQVQAIKSPPKGEDKGGDGYLKKVWDRTRFGGYGELDYQITRENGNGNGGNAFDPHRFVLYVNSDLTDWITLNTELEWEHGGVLDEPKKSGDLSGEASVEQAFLQFKLAPSFNIKAGVMLVPVGAINLYHEPTNINTGERPALDRYLVPTTWSEMGAGVYGSLGSKIDYQLLVMNGLDGSKFSAEDGIREGKQNLNVDVNRNKAITGRLEMRPFTNLYTNFSFYSANSASVGTAYTTIAAFDGKYSIADLDLAGEYVHVYQDNPGALGVSDIGHNMSGYWVEGAYHVLPKSLKNGKLTDADALVFARYSEFGTQQGSIVDPSKASGRFDRNYTNFGVVFKPTTTVSIKADYQIYGDHRAAGEKALDNDKFQVTLGFVF